MSRFAAFTLQNTFVAFHTTIRICENEIINKNTLEHASLIFTKPLALAYEIMLNIMQNFKFDFLENEF